MTSTPAELHLRLAPRWEDLCADLSSAVRATSVDPFESLAVTVAHPAVRRRLSQQLAQWLGQPGEGVCAGIDFEPLSRLRRELERDLLGIDHETDPWRSRGLAMAVLDVLDDAAGESWLALVEHHLAPPQATGERLSRPGRRLVTAHRIAGLLLGYAHTAPEMLRQWSTGSAVGPDGAPLADRASWQPELWRRVCALLAVPDPVARHDRLLAELAAGWPHGVPRERLWLFDPVPCEPLDRALVQAVAQHLPTTVWLLDNQDADDLLLQRFGAQRAESLRRWRTAATHTSRCPDMGVAVGGLLGAVQGEAGAATTGGNDTPVEDPSVQVHRAHGLDRQVEVLREVLTGLLQDDPSLEPRDVIVACTDLGAAAPLVKAAFELDAETVGGQLHPGHRLRVQLSGASVAEQNQVLVGLELVLALAAGRAESTQLLELCANAAVAACFDLTSDDLERISRLVRQAGVRWGLDGVHRGEYGLGQVRQSTWLAGLDRMLVGVVMGQQPPSWLATALPVDQVESSDVAALGKLAELVSRVRKQAAALRVPAPIGDWVARLAETISLLLNAPGDLAWQVAQAQGQLADLADLTIDRHAELELGDIRALFDRLLRPGTGRANHGNGSLLVGTLDDVAGLPHKVVVLLGLDDGALTGGTGLGGDDLCHRHDVELDHRQRRRQQLADAVLAARQTLVVVCQGFSPRTNEPVPDSVAVSQLGEVFDRHGTPLLARHGLMPHSAANFDPARAAVGSFDRTALEGALARRTAPLGPRARLTTHALGPVDEPTAIELEQLESFLRHPARELLRHNLGVSLGSFDDATEVDLPLDPSALDDWRIGHRMVELRLAGLDPNRVEFAERLRGEVPPGVLGTRVLRRVGATVDKVVNATMSQHRGELADVDAALELPRTRLTGRVRVHGDRVVSHAYSRVSGSHLVAPWLRLLLLGATQPPPVGGWRAVHVGKDAVAILHAPPPEVCQRLLAETIALRNQGMSQLVPLPVKAACNHAGITPLRPYGERDNLKEAKRSWKSERDADWSRFLGDWDTLLALPSLETDPGLRDPSRFVQLAEWFFGPLRDQLHVENLR